MKIRRIIAIILAIAVMAWIFYNSSQIKAESSAASGRVVSFLSQYGIFLSDHIVRKLAHFCEFALLGFLLAFVFEGKSWIGLIIGVIFACSDEIHQIFVDGRACQLRDVCIDSFGIVAGMAAAVILIFILKFLFGNNQKNANN